MSSVDRYAMFRSNNGEFGQASEFGGAMCAYPENTDSSAYALVTWAVTKP
jgi:hypothetical protein